MEIKWAPLTGRTGYILAAGALIPTYILNEKEIVLIDSGMHYDPGLISFFRAVGVSVRAVLQTHLHEDHVANNRILISKFGTKIYAHHTEIEITHSIERMRQSWLDRQDAIMDKYLRTYNYPVEPIDPDAGEIVIEDVPFGVVPLYGHSGGHLGFATPDRVLCTGDAVLSPSMVKYSKMPYFEKVGEAMETLRALGQMEYPYYALAHMEIIGGSEMPALAQKNLELLERIQRDVVDLIKGPVTMDELVELVRDGLNIHSRSEHNNAYMRIMTARTVEYLISDGRLKRVGREDDQGEVLIARV